MMKLSPCILALNLFGHAVISTASATDARPDLAEHLVQQLSSRTNGASSSFTGPTDGSNWFQHPPVLASNFWLRDVKNILAMSQGRLERGGIASCANYITPVSPHICIGAAHTGGGVGTVNVWLLPGGGYYSNTVVSCLAPTNSGDIMLMFMARTNWTFVKIFPDATNQLSYWRHPDPANIVPDFVRFHQGIGRTNQFHTTFASGSSRLGGFQHMAGQFEYGDYSKGDAWVAGDSGGAAYAIVDDEAVLVGCAWTPDYAMPVAKYENQINHAMAALCVGNHVPVEKIEIYDLSRFRVF